MFCRIRTTHRLVLILAGALIAPTLMATAASGQSLQERINNVRRQQARQEARQERGIRERLKTRLSGVNLQDTTAREAFRWVSERGDVPIVINWDRMQQAGIDPEQSVELTAERMTVRGALEMLLSQIAFDRKPILEVTPRYVRVMSRDEANRNAVIRVYPVGDLTMRTPNFTNAPEFDLEQITQGGGGGGGGTGGGQGSIFKNSDQQDEDDPFEQLGFEPAQRIADLIRQTVEPDLWRANGGLHGSITVFKNNLVVRAPKYVHRRIGGDARRTGGRATVGAFSRRQGSADGAAGSNRRGRSRDAGVDEGATRSLGSDRKTRDGTAGVEKRRRY